MTPPGSRVLAGGRAQAAAGDGAEGIDGLDAGPLWMRILPPVAMFAIALWRITGPSYWRDEAATMTAVARPFPQLLRMMGHVDAVHGVYYMIIWVVARLGGDGELVTRLPSAVAMACAAAAVAALGRRLVSPRAGLAAGLLFAALPQISLYGQEAGRPRHQHQEGERDRGENAAPRGRGALPRQRCEILSRGVSRRVRQAR